MEYGTFWVPECSKCIHNKECEEKHIYCDGINYEEKEVEEGDETDLHSN